MLLVLILIRADVKEALHCAPLYDLELKEVFCSDFNSACIRQSLGLLAYGGSAYGLIVVFHFVINFNLEEVDSIPAAEEDVLVNVAHAHKSVGVEFLPLRLILYVVFARVFGPNLDIDFVQIWFLLRVKLEEIEPCEPFGIFLPDENVFVDEPVDEARAFSQLALEDAFAVSAPHLQQVIVVPISLTAPADRILDGLTDSEKNWTPLVGAVVA